MSWWSAGGVFEARAERCICGVRRLRDTQWSRGVTRKANGIVPGREDSSHQKLSKPPRG